MTQSNDSLISQACDLTPSEQSLLVMRAALLVECLDTLGELAEHCQDLRRELAELPYTSAVARDKLMCEMNVKREQYKNTKNSLGTHKNNLAKTLYDIQARKSGENSLAPDADPMA